MQYLGWVGWRGVLFFRDAGYSHRVRVTVVPIAIVVRLFFREMGVPLQEYDRDFP